MGLASDLDLAWLELPLAASTHLHLAFETVDQTAELPETDGLEPCCLLGYPASLADKPSDAQERPLLDGACILTLSIESSRRRSPIFDLLTGDALALMDAHGAGRFHLVGHDLGGTVGMAHRGRPPATHRDSDDALTGPIRPRSPARWWKIRNKRERSQHHQGFRQPEAIERLAQDNFKLLRSGLEREGIAAAEADLYLRSLGEDGAPQAAINWYRASVIASAAIEPVSVPTLYIWGTADASVGRRAAELTAEFVCGPYRFVEIEGGGHFLVDQFAERIARLLVTHVQSANI
jgi:pimeloyl-ACP methyl ester carboxylesterase